MDATCFADVMMNPRDPRTPSRSDRIHERTLSLC